MHYRKVFLFNFERKQAFSVIQGIADRNGCTFDDVIAALYSNVVTCEISVQIRYMKTGVIE